MNETVVNNVQSPVSVTDVSSLDLSEGVGMDLIGSIPSDINSLNDLFRDAFARGLFEKTSPGKPLNLNEEEPDFPLVPLG